MWRLGETQTCLELQINSLLHLCNILEASRNYLQPSTAQRQRLGRAKSNGGMGLQASAKPEEPESNIPISGTAHPSEEMSGINTSMPLSSYIMDPGMDLDDQWEELMYPGSTDIRAKRQSSSMTMAQTISSLGGYCSECSMDMPCNCQSKEDSLLSTQVESLSPPTTLLKRAATTLRTSVPSSEESLKSWRSSSHGQEDRQSASLEKKCPQKQEKEKKKAQVKRKLFN